MILVTGATGNVGANLVRALVDAGEPVRALVRESGIGLPAGVESFVGDLNRPETLTGALAGVRAAFLLPGYDSLPDLLSMAKAAGVEHIALLSGSSVLAKDTNNAVSQYMIGSERAVEASSIPWTFVRPFAFMTNTLRWLPQLRAGDEVRLPFPNVPTATIDPFDIAAVLARVLIEPGHEGRTYTLTGPESLLPADQVRSLGEVLGRDLRFVGQTDEEARTEMSATMPEKYVRAFFEFYVAGTLDESIVLPTVREVTGRAPRTFRDWATAHADAFR